MSFQVVVHECVDGPDLGGVLTQKFGPQFLKSGPHAGRVAGQVVGTQGNNLAIAACDRKIALRSISSLKNIIFLVSGDVRFLHFI